MLLALPILPNQDQKTRPCLKNLLFYFGMKMRKNSANYYKEGHNKEAALKKTAILLTTGITPVSLAALAATGQRGF